MSKSFLYIIIVASIGMLSCKKSEVKFNDFADSDAFFEVSRSLSTKNGQTTEQNQLTTFYTDPSDEIWVNKTITELKKLNEKDKYVTKVKQKVGLPIWNRSLVFVGGDSTKTVITPIYDTAKKIVKGAIFSFHGSQFNCRVVPRSIVNSFRDTARSVNSVSKESIKAIFNYFDTQKANYVYNDLISGVNKIKVSEDNVITTGEIQYIYCYYVLVSSYNSGGVFQRQCVVQTYWGGYQEWDFYYSDFDNSEGYYDNYSEELLQKAEENFWELDHVDTISLMNNPCLNRVINKLISNPTHDFGRVVSTFFENKWGYRYMQPYNVKFQVSTILPNNIDAKHYSLSATENIIAVNKNVFNNCSDIFAAASIIHEFIHAYMASSLRTRQIGDTSIWFDFPKRFEVYATDIADANTDFNLNRGNHEYMAAFLTSFMAKALQQYDNYRLDYEYYWCLSWGGLENTRIYKYYKDNPMINESEKSGFLFSYDYALTTDRINKVGLYNKNEREGNANSQSTKHNNVNCY